MYKLTEEGFLKDYRTNEVGMGQQVTQVITH
jgi:hypothetical protein